MPRFKKVPVPSALQTRLQSQGSKHIETYTMSLKGGFVSVIKSDDPSGPNGETEQHLSIAASVATKNGIERRWATTQEVHDAMDAVGWGDGKFSVSKGGDKTTHVYKS